jgi:hypothetical protein
VKRSSAESNLSGILERNDRGRACSIITQAILAALFTAPQLAFHFPGKPRGLDHSKLMRAAGDRLVLVVSLQLKGDLRPIDIDHPRRANNIFAERRRRKMLDVNDDSDSAFSRLQQGQHGVAGRMLQKLNQPRRAQNLRHPVVSEVDQMRLLNDEFLLADRSSSYIFFHVSVLIHSGARSDEEIAMRHSKHQARRFIAAGSHRALRPDSRPKKQILCVCKKSLHAHH